MEVHHPHKKKEAESWKSKIAEFLMLFLAVFLGFLAEYKLEHIIESEWETEYLRSYSEDLHEDIEMLEYTIGFTHRLTHGLDSLQHIFFDSESVEVDPHLAHWLNFRYNRWILPSFNNLTITELSNSGNLALVKNKKILKALSQYDLQSEVITKNSEDYIDWSNRLAEDAVYIFNRNYIDIGPVNNDNEFAYVRTSSDAKLMTNDPKVLIAYANMIGRLKDIANKFMVPMMKDQLESAKELIQLINDEYGIDDH